MNKAYRPGGGTRVRTGNLRIQSPLFSQLNYAATHPGLSRVSSVFPLCHFGVCLSDSVSSNPAEKGKHSAAFRYRLRCPRPFTLFIYQKSKNHVTPNRFAKGLPTCKVIKTRFSVPCVPGRIPTRVGHMLNRKSHGGHSGDRTRGRRLIRPEL